MNSNYDNKHSQEIDLRFLWQKIIKFMDGIGFMIFKLSRFFLKNIILFIVLFIIGVVAGYFLDVNKNEIYRHQIIVIPNFDSSTYLYKKIATLNSDEYENIIGAEIEPVIDVFAFISDKWDNLKIAEFMNSNNLNIHEYKAGGQAEKIYKYHLLTIFTNKKDVDGSIIDEFLNELNQEPYFLDRQKIETQNLDLKIKEYEISVKDINALFEKLGKTEYASGNNVNIENHAQTNELLNHKNSIVDRINKAKVNKIEQEKVIYEVTRFSDIQSKPLSNMIFIPLMLIFLFIGGMFVKRMYKRYILTSL